LKSKNEFIWLLLKSILIIGYLITRILGLPKIYSRVCSKFRLALTQEATICT
jgi:hypothetical protein